MDIIKVAGKSIEVDEAGFLVNRADWSEEVAAAMARADGIELTHDHWEVIHFVRAFYDENQITPSIYMLARVMGEKLEREKGNSYYLRKLFPLPGHINLSERIEKYAGLLQRIYAHD